MCRLITATIRHLFLNTSPTSGHSSVTNNACERALRPAVIQRKVTNGFRSLWAAEGDCAVRTVTDTAKLAGKSPYQTIIETLA